MTINPEGNKVYLLNGWADQRLTVAVFCAKAGAEVYLDGAFRGTVGPDNLLNIPDVVSGILDTEIITEICRIGEDVSVLKRELQKEKTRLLSESKYRKRLSNRHSSY